VDKTIVFLHIDKTGGMSLREYLAGQFDREQIMAVVHHPEATYQPEYPTTHIDLGQAHHLFEVMYEPKVHQLIMGHWDVSILGHINNPVTIMVLREPFARFVSLYRCICQEQGQYPKFSIAARRMGIMQFAERYQSLYKDVMVAQLAGTRWCRAETRLFGASALKRAVDNLHQIDYVATRKHMYKLLNRLSNDFGWSVQYPYANRTGYEIGDIPHGVAEYVRSVCRYDGELYKYAIEREKEL